MKLLRLCAPLTCFETKRKLKLRTSHVGRSRSLRYVIEKRDAAGNVREILDRNVLVTPATAAYQAYLKHHPERLIMVRESGRIIRRSDQSD